MEVIKGALPRPKLMCMNDLKGLAIALLYHDIELPYSNLSYIDLDRVFDRTWVLEEFNKGTPQFYQFFTLK